MNLNQVLAQSGVVESVARDLGIDAETAQSGVSVLLPAIVAGLGRDTVGAGGSRATSPALGGLGSILDSVAGSSENGGLLDVVLGQSPTPASQGNEILAQIFGTKDVSRGVADVASNASGIDSGLLRKMLPIVAMAVVGYLANQSKTGAAQSQVERGKPDLGGILGSIIGGMMRR